MIIYYTHNFSREKGESRRMLAKAVAAYLQSDEGSAYAGCMCSGSADDADFLERATDIVASIHTVGDYGKPVIDGFAPFSVSHCKNTWGVLIGGEGFDLQYVRPADARTITKRFFPAEDAEKVAGALAGGEDAEELFFSLWTRREAMVKSIGSSVARQDIPAVCRDTVEYDGVPYYIRNIQIPGENLYAAICVRNADAPLEIVEL